MKKFNILLFLLCSSLIWAQAQNQRYLSQVFTEVNVQSDVIYGVNATVLALTQVGQAIPQPLLMDVYTPVGDTATERPLVLVFHSGNFLPFPLNGSTSGTKTDSTLVEICTRLAKRGFVTASVDYRLGWNPIDPSQSNRIFTLINAAYRGVQDARTAIRYFKRSVKESSNAYGIDSTKITLWGVGTGGYISLNTVGLDAYSKVLIPKFIINVGGNPVPMVIEGVNGNINGTTVGISPGAPLPYPAGDTLNYPNHVGYTSDFQLAVNLGGALGDSSWIDPGQPPVISFQVPTDPYAPYNCGVLSVPPPINLPVVDVCGANVVATQQSNFGNNQIWTNAQFQDPITQVANSRNGGREGLFPFPTTSPTDSAPWDFYAANNVNAGNATDPLDPARARMYIDTIMAYFAPRACVALGLGCDLSGVSSTKDVISASDVQLQMMPNPAYDQVRIQTSLDFPIQDVQVFDLSGKMVKSAINLKNSSYNLQRDNLSKGMYIVKLRFEQGIVTQKLIFN